MNTTGFTIEQAETVLTKIKEQYRIWLHGNDGPQLRLSFSWTGSESCTAIVWEEGPYEWSYNVGDTYTEEEFGFRITGFDPVPGVFTEAITSWAVGLYPEER